MKYVQFAIFTFPLFNNRKGFARLLLIFAFLIKILKGVLGELNQQKRRRKIICIPQALLMEETCCLFKSIFWWEKQIITCPTAFLWLFFLTVFSPQLSAEPWIPCSKLPAWEDGAGVYVPLPGCREASIHWTSQHSLLHPQSHFISNQPSWQMTKLRLRRM